MDQVFSNENRNFLFPRFHFWVLWRGTVGHRDLQPVDNAPIEELNSQLICFQEIQAFGTPEKVTVGRQPGLQSS